MKTHVDATQIDAMQVRNVLVPTGIYSATLEPEYSIYLRSSVVLTVNEEDYNRTLAEWKK